MSKRSHSQRSSSKPNRRKWRISPLIAILGAVLVVALIVAAVLIFAPRSGAPAQSAAQPAEISIEQAYQRYQNGDFFLDVRTNEEWDAFHVPGTTHIPLDQLADRVDEVPRDQPVVVVCRSGNRSRSGRDILLNAGFTDVVSVSGGLIAWSNAGYPIEGTRP